MAAEEAPQNEPSASDRGAGANSEAGAQRTATWHRAQASANAVRLAIGDRETLPLRGLQMRVQVDGFRARVVVDAYFLNDRGRNYEGNFQLRLPDGATPYFFAFGETTYQAVQGQAPAIPFFPASGQGGGLSPTEIMQQRAPSWNSPREARVVPRERAALAYTESVRQRVDPALMEWSGAGVFEARVFPLQAGRLHRVVFGYDTTLERVSGDHYTLPVAVPGDAGDVMVDLAIARAPGLATSVSPAAQSRSDGGYDRYRIERPRTGNIEIAVRGTPPVLVGSDPSSGPYLAAVIQPALPAADPSASAADRAVFMLDTSLSAQPDQFNGWLRMLQASLERNRPSMREFAVMFFDIDARWWRPGWTPNTPENVAALIRDANNLALEGATDLAGALRAASAPEWAQDIARLHWDTFLLSDGAATWGETEPARIARAFADHRRGPLYAYRFAGANGDAAMLGQIARESGGSVFSIATDSDVASAAIAHRTAAWLLRSVSLEGATDVILAGRPTAVYPGQALMLAARGTPSAGAAVTLTLERGGRQATVRVPLGALISSELAPRAYGQIAVGQMEELGDAAPSAATTAYATHFRIVGRTCSLVMLETEADYQRFGIVPANDSRTVRATPTAELIATVLQAAGRALGDAKAAFLAWLDRLPSQPGVSLQIPRGLREAVVRMPADSFTMPAEALHRRLRLRSELPAAYAAGLAAAELDYDVVRAEADRRRQALSPADALTALSSLVERRPGDTVLARDVAFTAAEWGLPGAGYHLLRRVAEMRPYEPHTYRSLGETLAAAGRNDLALAYFEVGLAGNWGPRTQDFKLIAGVEYLHFLREIARGARTVSVPEFARGRITDVERIVGMEQSDLLVMIAWNTDQTDVDLHVVEPNGEECYFGHRDTADGGHLTQDVTQGYGPEMFVLRHARRGHYRIFTHYYASHQSRASARTRVTATVIRNWGSANEQILAHRVVALENANDRQTVAEVDLSQ